MTRRPDYVRSEINALKAEVPMSELAARRGLGLQSNIMIICPHCRRPLACLDEQDRGYACPVISGGCGRTGDQITALEVVGRTNFPGAIKALEEMAADIHAEAGHRAAGQGKLL